MPINARNDYVALRRLEVESKLELDANQRFKNEGIVVGIGPGADEVVKLNDHVIFRPLMNPIILVPDNGDYAKQSIIFVKASDIIACI